MILVTGGRGRIARAAVARLLAGRHDVRVASRAPADLHFPPAVEITGTTDWPAALDGVTAVLLYAAPSGIGDVVRAAQAVSVAQITLVSAAGAGSPAASGRDPIARLHHAAEQVIQASGLPWTFLRPGALATNTLGWAESIRAERVVRAPYPDAHSALIHEDDVADVAARTLTDPPSACHGQAYRLTGPASLTQEEQVRHISSAIGTRVLFEKITTAQYRQVLARWADDTVIDAIIDHLRAADGRPDPVYPDFPAITGRPSTPFSQWATDHAAAFR
jgi:uncharacterized protein YbjT (DUF2867 family)